MTRTIHEPIFSWPVSKSCLPYSSVAFTVFRQFACYSPSCGWTNRYQILILFRAPGSYRIPSPCLSYSITRTLYLHTVPSTIHSRCCLRLAACRHVQGDMAICTLTAHLLKEGTRVPMLRNRTENRRRIPESLSLAGTDVSAVGTGRSRMKGSAQMKMIRTITATC